jgi:hypothetical protein
MSRTLVMAIFLAAWLATGITAGIVMGRRRHDRFPWWLLGVAFGPLLVPLALGAEDREEPTGQATPPRAPQDRSIPTLIAIDDSAAALTAVLDRRERKTG